jgi:hypothetical protein
MAGWTLAWGVKESFRRYVEAAGGSIEAGEGAQRTPDGGFVFEAAPAGFAGESLRLAADGRLRGRGEFRGAVRFEAHAGMLSVWLADPAVEIGPAGAALSVAEGGPLGRRLEIATLDLAAATAALDGEITIPAAITLEGMQVLGDHYPPSTPLDPVRLRPRAG